MGHIAKMRAAVISRDGGCVAHHIDPHCGPCRNRWGYETPKPQDWDLEIDYVRRGHHGPHHELASDHVALCPGHHRGTGAQRGYIWATNHRDELRGYLERKADEQETQEQLPADGEG